MTNPKGFTLLELMVVIAIIIIISTISIPFYQNTSKNLNLSSVARSLASDLRYAQQLSVSTQDQYGVIFNVSQNSYHIINQTENQTIKQQTINDNIYIQNISGLTNDSVFFNPAGAVSEAGIITLINSNNRTTNIEIKPSGYVKIQ